MEVTTKTYTGYKIHLGRKEIINLLRLSGVVVSDRAGVCFTVPSGGDWSGMEVDISEEHPITVSWLGESE